MTEAGAVTTGSVEPNRDDDVPLRFGLQQAYRDRPTVADPVLGRRKVARLKHGLLHRVKRVWRFLSHPALDVDAIQARLVRLVAPTCRVPELWLPVLGDLT